MASASAVGGVGPGGAEERDVEVLGGIGHGEADRDDIEEVLFLEVGTNVEAELIFPLLEGARGDEGLVGATIRVGEWRPSNFSSYW